MASANESPPDPIIFKMFGIKPDVHLQVFDQAFHVHSTALKMHSEFFCKFLGSPDKASSTSPSISGFEQNWVTQIDGDGTWSLVSKSVQSQKETIEPNSNNSLQIQAFRTLLQGFYNAPIRITSSDHLILATELADYYRCLPNLCLAVSAALLRSPELVKEIPESCCDLLRTAVKLRNPVLFKECILHAVGPCLEPRYLTIDDPKLFRIAERARRTIKGKIGDYYQDVLNFSISNLNHRHSWHSFASSLTNGNLSQIHNPHGRVSMPAYFRTLSEQNDVKNNNTVPGFKEILEPILENNLVLGMQSARVGEGALKDTFLCADVFDEDLPWDVNALEW